MIDTTNKIYGKTYNLCERRVRIYDTLRVPNNFFNTSLKMNQSYGFFKLVKYNKERSQ